MMRQLLTDFYLPWNTHLRNPEPISETPGYPKAVMPLWPPRKRCLKNLSCCSLKSNCILPFKTIPGPYSAISLLLLMTFTSSTDEVGSQDSSRSTNLRAWRTSMKPFAQKADGLSADAPFSSSTLDSH